MLGILEYVVDGLDLTFHQVAEHLVIREVLGDEGGGSVSAVSGTESVVDVAVSIGCEGLHELLLAFLYGCLGCLLLLVTCILCESARLAFLFSIEAEVLQKQSLARLEFGNFSLRLLAVSCKLYRNTEALGNVCDDVLEREFVGHSLRTSEVGHDDESSATCEYLLQGRDGGTDTGIIRNFEILVEGNVEVYANDGFLAREIIRVNVLLHNDIEYNYIPDCKFSNFINIFAF